jgi:hypothetical protein
MRTRIRVLTLLSVVALVVTSVAALAVGRDDHDGAGPADGVTVIEHDPPSVHRQQDRVRDSSCAEAPCDDAPAREGSHRDDAPARVVTHRDDAGREADHRDDAPEPAPTRQRDQARAPAQDDCCATSGPAREHDHPGTRGGDHQPNHHDSTRASNGHHHGDR